MTHAADASALGVDPRKAYEERRTWREQAAARLDRRHRKLGLARLALAAVTIVAGWLILDGGALPWWIVFLPIGAFLGLSVLHDRTYQGMERLRRAADHYKKAIERLEGGWAGSGERGEEFRDPEHLFAEDLDLFGRGSLFELVCTARTHAGQAELAGWLKEPAGTEEIRERQLAVAELRSRLDLREALAILGAEARSGVDSLPLAAWAARPPLLRSRAARIAAPIIAAATITAVAGWLLGAWGSFPPAILVGAQALFGYALRREVGEVVESVERAARDLGLLSQVLTLLEKESFRGSRLRALRESLESDGAPPSARIARLHRLVELLDSRRNQVFAPISPFLLWSTQLAFAIEGWRMRSGAAVGRWIAAVAEMEALSSLAGYSFEHPADPFPILAGEGPLFEAEALGHPLLQEAACVRNDLRIGGPMKLLVVSGSNMSGKSTLLRSVGINTVMALAGAPVRAARLSISPVHLGASIRTVDSLQDGKSRFYAEITRLSRILSMARDRGQVLYLLDELLSGTNSHDRRIGAEAIARGLMKRGAVGLLTTHDLALTRIAEIFGEEAGNVHFEDRVEGGEILFDYRIRSGVVERGNALELMRAVGIEI